MSLVGLWLVSFSTRAKDWETETTHATWTWSADRLIPTAFYWEACFVPKGICHQNSKNTFKDCTLTRIKFSHGFSYSFEGELHVKDQIFMVAPTQKHKASRLLCGSSTYAKWYRRSHKCLTRISKQKQPKASDTIATPNISIPSTQFLLIKLSIFVMLSIDHSPHLSFLGSKPNFLPDSARISKALQSLLSVPAIILSSIYWWCRERFGNFLPIS